VTAIALHQPRAQVTNVKCEVPTRWLREVDERRSGPHRRERERERERESDAQGELVSVTRKEENNPKRLKNGQIFREIELHPGINKTSEKPFGSLLIANPVSRVLLGM